MAGKPPIMPGVDIFLDSEEIRRWTGDICLAHQMVNLSIAGAACPAGVIIEYR
jgi:hypothetical protein